MKNRIHLSSKISFLLISFILLVNSSCGKKNKDEKEIVTLKKLYENGLSKEGHLKNNLKVGKWIWRDSITNEKLIEIFYTDTVIAGRKNDLTLRRYFDQNKLFLIERVLNEEQIIGLKSINSKLYTNFLNENEYHEAGQGIFLFHCSQCHLNAEKVKRNIANIDHFSRFFDKNNIHKKINLNKEEVKQVFLYIKKLEKIAASKKVLN